MNEYVNRKGTTIISLSMYFLNIEINTKIKSIQQFARDLNVARGTIQDAIKFLESKNAIELTKSGRSGTLLINKNDKLLFDSTGVKYLKGTMPLPYSKRYEGLAGGIYLYFNEFLNINFFMSYVRSSLNRIELIKDQEFDFAIVSVLYAKEAVKQNKELKIACNFGDNSYTVDHMIVYSNNYNSIDQVKVGIDYSSFDHVFLTGKFIAVNNYKEVQIGYNQIEEKLKNGEIDVAVVSSDEAFVKDFKNKAVIKNKEVTQAALVVNVNNEIIERFVCGHNVVDYVTSVQKNIQDGKIIPIY
jgi:hypothetical protein